MRLIPVVLACSALAGCASADCTSDWQGLGQRDGRLGAQPQAEAYAARCGGQADVARYMEGYRAGFRERPVPNW
ncbi:MAG TPA: hypothetical protein VET51_01220 [Burkholderiales bacterium]|nr:hypothetical protein [Burkholderiales bacterium]